MKLAVLVSGGKDSALALHRVLNNYHEVICLVSLIPVREDSWMFHHPNTHLITLFAEASEIPLVIAETSGIKEEELKDLKNIVEGLDVDGIVSGAISSYYQKKRIEKICQSLNLKSIVPLWGENPRSLLEEILSLEFKVIVTGVYAYGFNQAWLGRRMDQSVLTNLIELNTKHQVSIVGEGGEYETFVVDAPFFKKKICILDSKQIWDKESGYLLISEAILRNK